MFNSLHDSDAVSVIKMKLITTDPRFDFKKNTNIEIFPIYKNIYMIIWLTRHIHSGFPKTFIFFYFDSIFSLISSDLGDAWS